MHQKAVRHGSPWMGTGDNRGKSLLKCEYWLWFNCKAAQQLLRMQLNWCIKREGAVTAREWATEAIEATVWPAPSLSATSNSSAQLKWQKIYSIIPSSSSRDHPGRTERRASIKWINYKGTAYESGISTSYYHIQIWILKWKWRTVKVLKGDPWFRKILASMQKLQGCTTTNLAMWTVRGAYSQREFSLRFGTSNFYFYF